MKTAPLPFRKRQWGGWVIGEAFSDERECDVHHVRKVVLTLLGSRLLTRQDVVGDGADAKGALARTGGVHVKGSNLHLDGHDIHVNPLIGVWILVVEHG